MTVFIWPQKKYVIPAKAGTQFVFPPEDRRRRLSSGGSAWRRKLGKRK
jgi:hypothetical protein